MDGQLYLDILDRLAAGDDTPEKLAAALGTDQQAMTDAVGWAVGSMLARRVTGVDGERLELTPQGQMVVGLRARATQTPWASGAAGDLDLGSVQPIDLEAMAREISQAWSTAQGVQIAGFQSMQQGLLVGDLEREAATNTVEEAYAAGRLDRAELDRRIQLALEAKTRGDLDRSVEGLVDPMGDVMASANETMAAVNAAVSQSMRYVRWSVLGIPVAIMGIVVLVMVLSLLPLFG